MYDAPTSTLTERTRIITESTRFALLRALAEGGWRIESNTALLSVQMRRMALPGKDYLQLRRQGR